ncbi:NLI interacting factor [Pochonia chlamydosporia 170]|uniref:Mitochondrial import inner membrane translocase subunit TIM50 n=1 Tax=Pochonia chlamydosporia 170 TaxID=1380566 RepID=A0A179FDB3_METCM|nr:NLI interacting factor [Pochonia chlamydosporia 170]OAQ63482.1 NLI interacting factor [Pochonia chlamydosporia 170]
MAEPSLPKQTLNVLANSFTPLNNIKQGVKKVTSKIEALPKKGIKRKSKSAKQSQPPTSDEDNNSKKPRQPPSRASGGIPSPSTRYLTQSLPPPTLLPNPRRILVILDLNGTLLYRPSRRRPSTFIERPHARAFLKYCLDTFYLAIWSSARPQNVNNMVAQLLTPEERDKCLIIWARDRFGLSQQDYDTRVQVYKRLSLVWDDPQVRASHPDAKTGGRWDQSNTVLVDDSREKGRGEPHNILPIPEFSGSQGEPPNVLPQVHDYLNALCLQADISRYMRENPFALNSEYTLPAASC